jgi:murein DD-endopeptidase MepM/ murein hydrolase activator NlpD
MQQAQTQTTTPTPSYTTSMTALDIHLTAEHGGLPAGTEITIGYAEATAQAGTQAAPPPTTTTQRPTKPRKRSHAPEPNQSRTGPLFRAPPPDVHPKLTAGRYVFPIYGPSSFVDSYGAARADVAYHHGDDIFAPLGAPILAVADGTVFSVGWNAIGGNRLWLRDRAGNEFYYAHLSAFTPLAVNGAQVHAGDVLGFVGNTGDAQGTPYHLHFEVHPVGYLGLGYDGAVDPTPYLTAWEHLQDVRFDGAGGWAPAAAHSTAPAPGAILLQVSDISSASGLDPASLRRAFLPSSTEGEGSLFPTPGAVEGGPTATQSPAGR